ALSQFAVGYQGWQDRAPNEIQKDRQWPPTRMIFTPYLARAFSEPATYDMSLFGGSVYSTVDDTFRWEQAVNTGKVLSAASTDRLLTPSYVSCQTAARCGAGLTSLGLSEGRSVGIWNSHPITFVAGSLPDLGFEDATIYFTDARLTLVFLLNQS